MRQTRLSGSILHTIPLELLAPDLYRDTKDPCITFDGNLWHIYGTGGSSITEKWGVLHAVSKSPYGPFDVLPFAELVDKDDERMTGPQLCAPGVTYDFENKEFIMTIQTACFEISGTIHLFTSKDGAKFIHQGVVIDSHPHSEHMGVYDPHHTEIKVRDENGKVIGKKKICVYTGIEKVSLGKIYLLEKDENSWYGAWNKSGCVLNSNHLSIHHNQDYDETREWCTEGEQIIELDNETVSKRIWHKYGKKPIYILNAVGFYPFGHPGTRQHLFFAASLDYRGGYKTLGPLFPYSQDKETGHASLIPLPDRTWGLYRQERKYDPHTGSGPWYYMLDILKTDTLYEIAMNEIIKAEAEEKAEIKEHYHESEFNLV